MSLILNAVGWLLVLVSVIYGYLLSNVEKDIYLGINILAGLVFIASGIQGGTVDLYIVELQGITFGVLYIAISGVETYQRRKQKQEE